MKGFKIRLFKFEELSEDAKRRICDKERESTDNFGTLAQQDDAEERIDTLNAFCKLFDITYRIDYDHQHRFISWQFKDVDMNGYDWSADDISGKYLLRWLNRYYYQIRTRKWFMVNCDKEKNNGKSYKERYSKIIWKDIDYGCCFTGCCYDLNILWRIHEWYKKPNWTISLHDLFEDCFSDFMHSWEKEDDYRMSDEHIGDMISNNWYDKWYFADGTEFTGSEEELEDYCNQSENAA
jgi:hypothetical protein